MLDTASFRNSISSVAAAPRVLLAAEDQGLRAGIRSALEYGAPVQVVGEVSVNDEVVRAANHLCPDVVILGTCQDAAVRMSLVHRLMESCPHTHVVVLGAEPSTDGGGWELGLRSATHRLAPHVAVPASSFVSHDAPAAGTVTKPAGVQLTVLTGREREVLRLVSDGLSSKQIADQLNISVRTVESHRNQIMNKLQLRSIAQLTKFAIRNGLSAV